MNTRNTKLYVSIILISFLTSIFITHLVFPLPILLAFVLLIILLIPMFRKQPMEIFEPVNILIFAFIIGYVIKSLYLVIFRDLNLTWFERFFKQPEEKQYYLALALFYIILGTLAFYLGYFSRFGRYLATAIPKPSKSIFRNKTKVMVVLGLLITFGFVFYYQFMTELGGLFWYLVNFARRNALAIESNVNDYYRWGAYLIEVATYVWFGYHLTRRRNNLFWLFFLISSVVTITFGIRAHLFYMWGVMVIVYFYYKFNMRIQKKIILVAVICLILVIPYSAFKHIAFRGFDMNRFRNELKYSLSPKYETSVLNELMGGSYFGSLDFQMTILKEGEERLGFQYGKTFLTIFTMPIPQSYWRSKPVILGRMMITSFFPDRPYGANAPSFIGEAYINFHFVGIIYCMFFLGVFMKSMYVYMKSNRDNLGVILIFALTVIFFVDLLYKDTVHGLLWYLQRLIPLLGSFALLK